MKQVHDPALNACVEAGVALTPSRLAIFETISGCKMPVSAYEVQAALAAKNQPFKLATIYRVIDFWCGLGLVHKIASLIKFHACANPAEAHTHMVNVCVGIREASVLEQSAKEGVAWLDGVRHMLQEYNPTDRHTIPLTGNLFEG